MIARTPILLLAALLAACKGGEDLTQIPTTSVPPEATAWIKANAIPFTTSQAGGPYADLMPVKNVVGGARLVSLGEATHGTREFFEMKHRMLEFLVREMGFNVFAIESEFAEATRIDRYVHTGQGDAQTLLTGLYFWTWRTQEVLDMIEWMRAYNADPSHPRKVSFVGVDTQFPTMAMDTVVEYLLRADTTAARVAGERYACLRPYSNDAHGGHSEVYRLATDAYKADCRARVQQVHDDLVANGARLQAATSPAEYTFAVQAARVAMQGEEVISERDNTARDRYMAENAGWWLERNGADAKMLLWAHNAHVSTQPDWMGSHLRARYGQQMRVFGFRFYQGSFTAVNLEGGPFGTYSFGPAPAGTSEDYLHSAGLPRFILDLHANAGAPGAAFLHAPRLVREVGCCVRPSNPSFGYQQIVLADAYDALIYFENTTASRTLAPRWP
ncbi:MAG TPA: erythromycin esterase family protein [Longimicrobium sp.]|nr:erythromycin esterase family protein [Longimicrobium sp.]